MNEMIVEKFVGRLWRRRHGHDTAPSSLAEVGLHGALQLHGQRIAVAIL